MSNIYCDENCHLENDKKKYMVMGAITCDKNYRRKICNDIRIIKEKYGLPRFQEIKWTKVSEKKEELYKELITYFFNNSKLQFRAIIIDKDKIDNKRFNQSYDTFYYKVYYQLLCRTINPKEENFIYLDVKDTRSSRKIKKLEECLKNGVYDFNIDCIKNVQSINSKESEILQICDVLIGAIGYLNRGELLKKNHSISKEKLIDLIINKSGYNLKKTTFLSEEKFNLFFMELR